VPPHRAELGHLLKIIEGKSTALVLMRSHYGPIDAARSIVGGFTKMLAHGPVALAGGRSPAAIRAKMRCAVGRGQIVGVLRRWGLIGDGA
jgi:hypothetical protein